MGLYVVTGATGNTGKPIALGLLEKGHKVRIISRDAAKAAELVGKGAELFVGDTTDVELCKKAFAGAFGVYMMVPPNMQAADVPAHQAAHINAMTEAIKATGVQFVVTLSSVGAHLSEGAGVVQALSAMESGLNAIENLNVVHLRAGYFMENLFAQVGAIKNMAAVTSPVKGDIPIPMVATRDIAQTALDLLLELKFTGKNIRYVLGQRDVTYDEVAKVLGNAVGIADLKYFAASPEQFEQAMLPMGMSKSMVDKLNEFVAAMNSGAVLGDAKRDADNTTVTSIEDFANVFSIVYSHS